mgnify:CR=1 FL=1
MLRYLKFYKDRGIIIERAKDQYVWDINGTKYLDFHTGHGVAFLGHRNPHVVNTLINQLNKIMTLSTSFRVKIREEMLELLSKIVPLEFEYVTLLNSGSEAVDFALKVARKATGRKKIIYFHNSFHGRTFGALSVTGNIRYRRGFEPLVPEAFSVKYNDINEIEKVIDENTAAVILELIQGEGGINIANMDFVKVIKQKCMEVGALLIIDEIQTGFGRTGKIWAFQHYNILPDILISGKAIGGGFPVSVVFLQEFIANKLNPGDHGSTYGGNPLACAAVKASTEVLINNNVPEQAMIKGTKLISMLKKRLSGNRLIRDIRGLGLMIGIELRIKPQNIIQCAQANGLLILKAGLTVARLLPPYLINDEDISWGVEVLDRCINEELSNKITN